MTLVVLQPASNKGAQQHYADTIERPVVLADHAAQISAADLAALRAVYPSGAVPLWGATPGKEDRNRRIYERMSVGDLVLFSADGGVFSGGTVTHLLENAPLAERLWGRDSKDQTWELMFSLAEIRSFAIPYAELNQVVGYKPNNIIQGISVLDEGRSASLIDYLSLESPVFASPPPAEDVAGKLAALTGTERTVISLQRLEQRLLRTNLLPGPTGECALCGRSFPVGFLVAAHIKKRSQCSQVERLSANVVMAACTFGCDALFEGGYVCVGPTGTIVISSLVTVTPAVQTLLAQMDGRTCPAFDPDRAPYFAWHQGHTFRAGAR